MTQSEILEVLEKSPGLTSEEISQVTGRGLTSTRRCLNTLNRYKEVRYKESPNGRGWGIPRAWKWFKC
jgi:DNA-binding IclR family transcriptional regulator